MSIMIKWGIIFVLATFLTTLALQDNGLVSIVWREWVIETSVSFLLVIIAVGIIALYLLTRLWAAIIIFPRHWREAKAIKRHGKAEDTLNKGMVALEYGNWKLAEKQLIKSAKFSSVGLIHYLSAAKMAHNQQAFARRDKYLTQAKQYYLNDHEAIGLVEARLLKATLPQKSLAILQALHKRNETGRAVLAEYASLVQTTKNWQLLAKIMPQIKKISALEKDAIEKAEIQIISAKIAESASNQQLDTIWQQITNSQQLQVSILAEFVEQKIGWQQQAGLAELIIKSLAKKWDDRLVYQYGRLKFTSAIEPLKITEKWLKKHQNNAVLHLTIGRIACQGQLWAIAQTHLKTSLKLNVQVETYHALAKCYEKEGLETKAAIVYKQAILELDKKSK